MAVIIQLPLTPGAVMWAVIPGVVWCAGPVVFRTVGFVDLEDLQTFLVKHVFQIYILINLIYTGCPAKKFTSFLRFWSKSKVT